MKKLISNHRLFIFFAVSYLVVGLLTYKDFGPTFDEVTEYTAGSYLYKYYVTPTSQASVQALFTEKPEDVETRHLPLFSVYSRIYPMLLSLANPQGYFEWYHLSNIFFGFGLFVFAYLLLLEATGNPKKAILGPIALVLTPYLTGHIPGNPKDIPFATAYLASMYIIYLLCKRNSDTRARVLALGITFGVTMALRAVGITLLGIYTIYALAQHKLKLKDCVLETILIAIVAILVWAILLPFIGANLPTNLVEVIFNAANYSEWNGIIYYLGEYLSKEQRPWHYLFILMAVKLPIATLALFAGKIASVFKKPKVRDINLLLLLAISTNLALYLVTKPVIYNGARHFLYLIVLITLVATLQLVALQHKALVGIIIVYGIFTMYRMVKLHPYEYVYFNELTFGLSNAQHLFQLDYWGASYKEAAEYIRDYARTNKLEHLKIFTCDNPFAVVYYSEFAFDLVGSPKEANLLICDTFRDAIRNFDNRYPIFHTINREHTPLTYIRLRQAWD